MLLSVLFSSMPIDFTLPCSCFVKSFAPSAAAILTRDEAEVPDFRCHALFFRAQRAGISCAPLCRSR